MTVPEDAEPYNHFAEVAVYAVLCASGLLDDAMNRVEEYKHNLDFDWEREVAPGLQQMGYSQEEINLSKQALVWGNHMTTESCRNLIGYLDERLRYNEALAPILGRFDTGPIERKYACEAENARRHRMLDGVRS